MLENLNTNPIGYTTKVNKLHKSYGSTSVNAKQSNETAPTDQADVSPEARHSMVMLSGLQHDMFNKALSLGRSVSMEVDGQVFRVRMDSEGMWISTSQEWNADDFKLVDPSAGVPGIASSTIRAIEYNIMLRQRLPASINISSQEDGGFGLRGHMKQMVNAFALVAEEVGGASQQHSRFIEDAFRGIIQNHFGMAAQTQQLRFMRETAAAPSVFMNPPDPEIMEQVRIAGQAQADTFLDVFFSNIREHGIEGAFDIAWSALQ